MITFKNLLNGLNRENDNKEDINKWVYLEDDNTLDSVLENSQKFIVYGSKGSGKTYLAKYICNDSTRKSVNNQLLDASKFLNIKVVEQIDFEKNTDQVWTFFQWSFYKILSEYIIKDYQPQNHKYSYFVKRNKLRLFENKFDENGSLFKNNEMTQETIQKVEMRAIKKFVDMDINRLIQKKYRKKQYFELLGKYEHILLRAIPKNEKINFIIDELDNLTELNGINNNNNLRISIMINLIYATKHINQILSNKGYGIKFILLMRTDIINELQYSSNNLRNILDINGVELNWMMQDSHLNPPEEHPIMKLILHKIKVASTIISNDVKNEIYDCSNEELYNKIFPEKIQNKTALEYLLNYSFGCPGEILCYLKIVMAKYPKDTTFTANRLKDSRRDYKNEIDAIFKNKTCYFNLKSEYICQCLLLIRSLSRCSFSVEEIRESYNKDIIKYSEIKDVTSALEFLYQMSVIGNVWDGGRQSSWRYKSDGLPSLSVKKRITIHYCFRD